MLARREHSAFELRRKLQHRDMADTDIALAIEQLQREGLLSDRRFAESYIHMRKNKGYGPVRIAAELRQKGVAEDDFEPYLYADDINWSAVLMSAYEKKYGKLSCADYQEKAKRMRYLQYRGFTHDKIHELLG
ncbi:MAG: regulatory protein RecX [Gammaproteobacteria bacterium]